MLKNRLIVCLLLRNGVIVQSKGFKRYQSLGNPTTIVQRLTDWACDELIYLDISPVAEYDLRRDDLKGPNRDSIEGIIKDVASCTFMPLTFGGGIRSLDDIYLRLKSGADKITINTKAIDSPDFIEKAAREFGSQCIVVSIDAKKTPESSWRVFKNFGKTEIDMTPLAWAKKAESLGCGEIFLNSIDRDGAGGGYDIELISSVVSNVRVPVIACGGAGEWQHMAECLKETGVSAVCAANIFHYTEHSVYNAKRFLYENSLDVRMPMFFNGT